MRRAVPVVLAVIAVIALAAFGLLLNRHSSVASAAELTETEHACQQWRDGYSPATGTTPANGWCSAMTGWMRQELHSGYMTGPMMWGNAASMGSVCRQWIATHPPAAAGVGPQVCDDMVAWMASRAGDWNRWMRSGHMMGP